MQTDMVTLNSVLAWCSQDHKYYLSASTLAEPFIQYLLGSQTHLHGVSEKNPPLEDWIPHRLTDDGEWNSVP